MHGTTPALWICMMKTVCFAVQKCIAKLVHKHTHSLFLSLSLSIYIYIYICTLYSWFSVQFVTEFRQLFYSISSVDFVDRTLAWFEIIDRANSDEYMRSQSYSYQLNCMDYWMIIQTIISYVLLLSWLLTLIINSLRPGDACMRR